MKLRNKKTGEITTKIDVSENGEMFWVLGKKPCMYDTLSELNEEWEDYKPKEPLIKDEKIRKTVRAWAEVNDIVQVGYDAYWNAFRTQDFAICFSYDFDRIDGLRDTGLYTIAELCGEEDD